MGQILKTNDLAEYLKLHPITICKYAEQGIIPAKRIGRVWRFEKEAIDNWVATGNLNPAERKRTGKRGKKS